MGLIARCRLFSILFLFVPIIYSQSPLHWEKANGPSGGKVIDIAIDPVHTGVLYVAIYPITESTLDGGIFKSMDGGATWTRKSQGIVDPETWSVSLDPGNPENVWAGDVYGNLYLSRDAGENWSLKRKGGATPEAPDDPLNNIYCIEVDPFNSLHIVAGTWRGHFLLSEDGGATWTVLKQEHGLELSGVISELAFDPDHEGILYLSSGFFDVGDFIGNGLFKSMDGGHSWRRLENGLEGKCQFGDLVIDPFDSSILYAANGSEGFEDEGLIFKSNDAGEHWRKIDIHSMTGEGILFSAIAVHPNVPGHVITMSGNRTFISDNGGDSWEILGNTGIIGIATFIEYNPLNTDELYCATYAGGVFKSTDGGRIWKDSCGSAIAYAYVEGLATHPDNPGQIFTHSFENGFHYSLNFGDTWSRGHESANHVIFNSQIEVADKIPGIFIVSRGNGRIIRADSPDSIWEDAGIVDPEGFRPYPHIIKALNDGKTLMAGTMNHGIYETGDGGRTWIPKNQGIPEGTDISSIEQDPRNPNVLFAGAIHRTGSILKSTNRGESWTTLNDEITFTTIHAMAVDPRDDATVYAAPWGANLFKSTNGGQSWKEMIPGNGNTGLPPGRERAAPFSLSAIAVHPGDSNVLFATSRAHSLLMRSEDGGENWFLDFAPDEDKFFRLHAFTMDPTDPDTYYVAAWNMVNGQIMGDLLRHYPEGDWHSISAGLPRAVLDVVVDPDHPETIYASTHIYGLYRSDNRGTSWQQITSFPQVGIFDLEFHGHALYAATNCGDMPEYLLGGLPQIEGDCGLYKSVDGGMTWINTIPESMRSTPVKQVSFFGDYTYIATNDDAWTTLNDHDWSSLNLPFKETAAIIPTAGSVYVGTHGGGLYYQKQGDTSWKNNGPYTELKNLQIFVDPMNSNTLYASAFPGGVFKSSDGGLSWNEKNFGLPSFHIADPMQQGYYSLVPDPHAPDRIFLTMFGKGVYTSLDGAETWFPTNAGLDNKAVYSLKMDASGSYLYAGTNGGSVFKATVSSKQVLLIPHIANPDEWLTSLVVDNTGTNTATGTLNVFDEGNTILTRELTVPSNSRITLNLTTGTCATFSCEADHLVLNETFLHRSEGGMAEYSIDTQTASNLVFLFSPDSVNRNMPQGIPERNELRWAGMAVMNPWQETVILHFTAEDEHGAKLAAEVLDLGPHMRFKFLLSDLFAEHDATDIARVRLESTRGVCGITLTGSGHRILLFSRAVPETEALRTLYIPHIAKDKSTWRNDLIFDNVQSHTVDVQITLFRTGTVVHRETLHIHPGYQTVYNLDALNQEVENGTIELSESLIVRQKYLSTEGGAAEFLLNQKPESTQNFMFPAHLSDRITWKGFALFNTTDQSDTFTLKAYHQGTMLVQKSIELPGQTTFVDLISNVFQGLNIEDIERIHVSGTVASAGLTISGHGHVQLLFTN